MCTKFSGLIVLLVILNNVNAGVIFSFRAEGGS